ncbi:MAG: hypothetical protein ABIG89_06290 [Candidatus Woesearchaeota archaeon]
MNKKRGVIKFNKRGITLDLIALGELILISMVFIGMIVYVYNIKNDTLFEKRTIVRDLSLLANTIQSVPGNTFYVFTPTISGKDYAYEFVDNLVILSEKEHAKLGYPFFVNKFIPFHRYALIDTINFTLSKFNEFFVISSEKRFGPAIESIISEEGSVDYVISSDKPRVDKESEDDKEPTDNNGLVENKEIIGIETD